MGWEWVKDYQRSEFIWMGKSDDINEFFLKAYKKNSNIASFFKVDLKYPKKLEWSNCNANDKKEKNL